MPFTLEISNANKSLVITSDLEITLSDDDFSFFQPLLIQADIMYSKVPLSRIRFERDPVPASPYTVSYLYRINSADGRVWKQQIAFTSLAASPEMDFTVNDFWKLSEFEPQRIIRDHFVMLAKTKQVVNVDLQWL